MAKKNKYLKSLTKEIDKMNKERSFPNYDVSPHVFYELLNKATRDKVNVEDIVNDGGLGVEAFEALRESVVDASGEILKKATAELKELFNKILGENRHMESKIVQYSNELILERKQRKLLEKETKKLREKVEYQEELISFLFAFLGISSWSCNYKELKRQARKISRNGDTYESIIKKLVKKNIKKIVSNSNRLYAPNREYIDVEYREK